MKSWRLNWALGQIFSAQNYAVNYGVMQSSWKYWLALLVKFFPRFWKAPILFRLKKGGSFYVKEFMTLYIYKEIFFDKCYDMPALSANEPVILDIGANTGLFTLRMKQLYPNARLFCFEPFASNFKQLSDNVKASNLNGISLFEFGVGGLTRKEKLYIHKSNIGGHSIFRSQTNSDEYTEIEIVSIQDLFKKIGITKCSLLKMDCEGAEYEIIKNINSELAQSIEKIIFEPTPAAYNTDELKLHLKSIGFSISDNPGLCVAINTAAREVSSQQKLESQFK